MAISKQAIVDAVKAVRVPGQEGSLLDSRMITELDVTPTEVRVVLASDDPNYPHKAEVAESLQKRPRMWSW
jgi:hypothetical protein